MASLLGKADSTIAGMSLKEAMADVMPDYSDIYKQKAEGFEENQLAFQKAVGDYFDIQHADNNRLADELKEATTKVMQGLGTDYEGMELFNSHLTSMKDRMKALPKNKKGDFERSKIRAEMNQLLESSNGLDDTLNKVGTMINAGEFNKHTTDYPALLAISEGRATKEIVDGNLVYTYKDAKGKKQTIDRQGIEDALGQSDLEIDGNFIKQGPEAFKLGKQGGKFNRNKSVNGYEKMFTTPAGLAANMNEKQGGLEYTFVESLAGKDGSESIYKALTNMGPTTVAQYDANDDGKITEADFVHPDNGIALIESLTNPRSDNYNFQAAKRAAAEFYADNIDQVEFNDGKSLRPPAPGSETSEDDGGFTLLRSNKSSRVTGKGGGYTPNSALNYIGKSANDRADIDLGDDKFIWDNNKKAYTLGGETINNKYSLFSTIYGEDFDPADIISMYNNIEDWSVDTRQEETFDTKTNLDINFVNKADQTVAADLNNLLPPPGDTRNPNAYIFKPLAAFENMTGIYKEGGGIERFPKVYPEGHPKAGEKHPRADKQAWFRTKGKTTSSNTKNLDEMIDLLQTFGLYEYIPKQLP
jgi:hypothetical protein